VREDDSDAGKEAGGVCDEGDENRCSKYQEPGVPVYGPAGVRVQARRPRLRLLHTIDAPDPRTGEIVLWHALCMISSKAH